MAVIQSTFSEDIPGGYAGMEADGELSNIISRTLEGSDPCEFGRPVYRGTADRGCDLTVGSDLLGFALATKGLPVTADRVADTYIPGDTIPIKNRGKLWVNCVTAAADGEQVYVETDGDVSHTSGGNTIATDWFFDDTISGAGVVRIVRR